MVDEALGRLAGSSLLTFSVDGGTVTAHRLVMRVIRERLARQGHLAITCQCAAATLQARAGPLERAWQDRPARRDLVEQIITVHEHAAPFSGESGSELTLAILGLRGWAVWFLGDLGDSATQAIQVAGPLLADQEQVLGPDHPGTLQSRNYLAVAYVAAGRAAEAIALLERTLASPSSMAPARTSARYIRHASRAAAMTLTNAASSFLVAIGRLTFTWIWMVCATREASLGKVCATMSSRGYPALRRCSPTRTSACEVPTGT